MLNKLKRQCYAQSRRSNNECSLGTEVNMSVQYQYLSYKRLHGLNPGKFSDRVKLQLFLRDLLPQMREEGLPFTSGGLVRNYMTGFALGFAYYDCRATRFCSSRCYGLPLGGVFDFNMLRLSVATSELLRTHDRSFVRGVINQIRAKRLDTLKIGHWGDATLEQLPAVADIASAVPATTFWWYTRKLDIAAAANQLALPNLRAYLSLDPDTDYPGRDLYPYGITYLYGDNLYHERHDEIVRDERLVAIFTLKKGTAVEDPERMGLGNHPRICLEKRWKARTHSKGELMCLSCRGRCNYQATAMPSGCFQT